MPKNKVEKASLNSEQNELQISDPIPLKYQGLVFGIMLFVILPILTVYWMIEGMVSISWGWVGFASLIWYAQMVGVLIGYHRFFSHRSFKTGKTMRIILGLLGCISGQKGPLFWASHHRHHHNECEEEHDVHSPYKFGDLKGWNWVKGFYWSHFGHLIHSGPTPIETATVRDLIKKPELIWMEKYATTIFYSFGLLLYLACGLEGLLWGFMVPSFFSWNCVMLVNSAVHIWGEQPFKSKLAPNCEARNVWWLSLPMLGDNWHNNHHADMMSARAGMKWWQVDINWYLIWILEKIGLIWDVRHPNPKLLDEPW